MTSAMTKSGPPEYGGANGSAHVDSVTTHGVVVQVNTDWPNGRVAIHRCTVQDVQTGIKTTDLPCAGMNLQPGEAITITIQRQNAGREARTARARGDA